MLGKLSRLERLSSGQKMLLGGLVCVLVALLAAPLREFLDPANMVMLFLLTVLLIAVSLGRNAAVLASVLNVLLFDIFFVPPHFSLAVSNLQYLITFVVMLVTALITAQLTASLKEQAAEAERRERRTHALYQIASRLAGALNLAQVQEIVEQFVSDTFLGESGLVLGDDSGSEQVGRLPVSAVDLAKVMKTSERQISVAGAGHRLLFPLRAPMRVRGAFVVQLPQGKLADSDLALLEALSSLVAIAVERLHYVEVAQQSELETATERLRSSILSALSHDLRTPLTVLVGLADSICLSPDLPATVCDSAGHLRDQAGRLAGLVANLLEMARLHAGSVTLRQEWQPLEEVLGSSLKLLGEALGRHRLHLDLPRELPLLRFDAVLIERVLCNLLENAAKYSPPSGQIRISAAVVDSWVEVAVSDEGPGFPEVAMTQVFGMFVRGQQESSTSGTGLGLAICKAIVDAHGGMLRVENPLSGGGRVVVSLPRGNPPSIELEAA